MKTIFFKGKHARTGDKTRRPTMRSKLCYRLLGASAVNIHRRGPQKSALFSEMGAEDRSAAGRPARVVLVVVRPQSRQTEVSVHQAHKHRSTLVEANLNIKK